MPSGGTVRRLTAGMTAVVTACVLTACQPATSTTGGVTQAQEVTVSYTPDYTDGPVIYPEPGAKAASAATQITFRGLTQDEIDGKLSIVGSESGDHSEGTWIAHSDGEGVSFQPTDAFTEGEDVTVTVDGVSFQGDDDGGSTTFHVATAAAVADEESSGTSSDSSSGSASSDEDTDSQYASDTSVSAPTLEVTRGTSRLASDTYLLLNSQGSSGDTTSDTGAGIYSSSGDLLYWTDSGSENASNVSQLFDGTQTLLAWWQGTRHGDNYTTGTTKFENSSYEAQYEDFTAGNGYSQDLHETQLTSRGTALITIYSPIVEDLTEVGGTASDTMLDGIVQEVDLTTGAVLFEWHGIDHVAYGESYTPRSETAAWWDWLHINSIQETADGDLLVSVRDTNSLMLLDRETGTRIWKLGGRTADEVTTSDASLMDGVQTFTMEGDSQFWRQHDARIWADRKISLYDNENSYTGGESSTYSHSRGLVLDVDQTTYTVSVDQSFVDQDKTHGLTQGSVVRLSDGGALVSWGNTAKATEFDANGNTVANWTVQGTAAVYRIQLAENWVGTPTTSPSTAVEDGDLLVSWNGATQVVSWRVVDGSGNEVTTVDKDGFETRIALPEGGGTYTVEALDASGTVLGTSAEVDATDS